MDLNGQPRIPLTTRLKRAALAFDAWLNASLYSAGRRMSDGYERFSERSDKLRVRGFKRAVLDLASEATTLGTGAAVVMLALALPAFRETSENWLKSQELAVTFLDRYGQEIGRRGIRHDDSVKLEEFPDYLIKAALATEDRRFFEHWGIDPIGTFRALSVNARGGGVVQGGSSITQQLAKNIFLNNERSLERKVKEAFLAVWLEFHLSKQDILKLYLDRAYMGGGTFGAAAAAEYYFGKSVKDISLAESAMLAGLFKAPTKYAPHVNLPAARARANDVLNNMVEAGFLTEGQIQTARRNPATPIDRKRDTTPEYYLDWAFEQVKKLAGEGKLGNDRVVVVKTPLDQGIQRKVEQASESLIRQYGNQYDFENAAMVVMDPDGAVRAMVGGQRLRPEPVQPGDGRAAPAGLVVQDLCLLGGALGRAVPPEHGRDRHAGLHRQLVPGQLQSRLLRRIDAADRRLREVDQHHPGDHVDQDRPGDRRQPRRQRREDRPRQDHPDGARHGPDDAAQRHGLAADRRRRGDGDRPGGGLRRVRERRQARAALCGRRGAQFRRRRDLPPRQREAARAGALDAGRRRHELHAEQGRRGRHRQARHARRRQGRRARPAPPTPIATPGSSASPATSSARCGWATTTIPRPTR